MQAHLEAGSCNESVIMAQVFMVSTAYLKENSVIEANVDEKVIRPNILKAQDKYIQPILGTRLYDKIKTDITAGSISGVYKTLLDDYIAPCLVNYIVYETFYSLHLKLMNKSVATRDSESASAASMTDVQTFRQTFFDDGQWYAQRMIDYLCEFRDSYPEYRDFDTRQNAIKPVATMYTKGMFLGRTIRKSEYEREIKKDGRAY